MLIFAQLPVSSVTVTFAPCLTWVTILAEVDGVLRTFKLEELLDSFTVVLESDFANIDLTALDIYGALEDGVDLFPTPKEITIKEGIIPLSAFTGCCADCKEAAQGKEI